MMIELRLESSLEFRGGRTGFRRGGYRGDDASEDRTYPPVMHSHVHLVIVFTFPTKPSNKFRLREDTRNAEEDYTKLLRLLESSGLKVVGKVGRRHGEIIVLVHSPLAKLNQLARLEQ